jgi:iron(III) transport system permease protein
MYVQTEQIRRSTARRSDRLAAARLGVLILFANRLLLGNHSRFVTPAARVASNKLDADRGRRRSPVVLYGFFATVLPIAALVIVSLGKFWSGSVDPSTFTLETWRTVTTASGVMPAIWNSIQLSVIAALATLPIAYISALFLRKQREHRVAGPTLDFVIAMPLSIPAVIFGVGFLLTYTSEPLVLYGTKWVIVLVYITLMIRSRRACCCRVLRRSAIRTWRRRASREPASCGCMQRSCSRCCAQRSQARPR